MNTDIKSKQSYISKLKQENIQDQQIHDHLKQLDYLNNTRVWMGMVSDAIGHRKTMITNLEAELYRQIQKQA